MVRRAQQGKRALQRARDETERQLGSDKGSYRPPPREVCDPKSWYQTFDDASTVRVSIMLWRQNGRLVDFVILVESSAWNAWTEVSRIDCCHGFCHVHRPGREAEQESLMRLDTIDDVEPAQRLASQTAEQIARTLRDRGVDHD